MCYCNWVTLEETWVIISLVIKWTLPWKECQRTLLMASWQWFGCWIVAIGQRAINLSTWQMFAKIYVAMSRHQATIKSYVTYAKAISHMYWWNETISSSNVSANAFVKAIVVFVWSVVYDFKNNANRVDIIIDNLRKTSKLGIFSLVQIIVPMSYMWP